MPYILYAIYAVLIVGPIYLIWAVSNMNKKMKKIDWLNAQQYTVLRVDVPRNNEKSPLAAEQMFAAIHGIFSESAQFQNHLSFEIVSKDKYIQFYIYLPVHLRDFVEGQIYAQYPAVEIHEVDDYAQSVDVSSKNYAICELALNKPDVYPIKQFTDFEVDPISSITSVMSKLNQDEEVWIQLIVRPIGDEWQERGHSMVSSVRNGDGGSKGGFGKALRGSVFRFAKELVIQAIKPGTDTTVPPKEIKLPASVEEALKSIEQKITKLGFESKIRILSLGNDPTLVRLKCQNIGAAYKQFNTTNLNGFKLSDVYLNEQAAFKDFLYRSFEGDGDVFNIAELASLFHLPSSSVSTPNIVWSGSKKGEPPANLPLRENVPVDDFTVLGLTNFRNAMKEFGIKKDDRRRHIYIIGKSGTGKSTLIENMVINDIVAGKGVILVDPHGETSDKILACIPDHRVDDVIVFDPADREFPVAFNLLEAVDDDFKGIVASGFVGIFKKIFGDSWGPRLEHILRNTVLALLDCPESTMLDIPKMLTNNNFRDKIVNQVKDPVIKDFWVNEFAQYDSKFRTEAVSPILNKVGQFLATSTIRNIVGQPHSRLNIRQVMDQQKVMLVNLSRGKIGEDNSALLGAMMITKIQLAAMSRADVTVDQRPDCFLYVDEFQNFATESFATILSEARKYNLSLTIAHQYIAQMQDTVKDAVFGNAGTLISFRVGGTDADTLVKEYAPVFDVNDMVNLEKAHIYIKLLIDGIAPPAFSAKTLPPVAKLSGNLEQVVNLSHQKYSIQRSAVEAQLEAKSKQEEEDLRKEAELFKTGGLEALLLKKNIMPVSLDDTNRDLNSAVIEPIASPIAETTVERPVVAFDNPPPSERINNEIDTLGDTTDSQDNSEHIEQQEVEPKSDAPRLVKYKNILDGKIYKERTARGNVKWYLGEDVDEEKLLKSGVIVDDEARRLVLLTKKIASSSQKSQNGGERHHVEHQNHSQNDKLQINQKMHADHKDEEHKPNNSESNHQSRPKHNEAISASVTALVPDNKAIIAMDENVHSMSAAPQNLPIASDVLTKPNMMEEKVEEHNPESYKRADAEPVGMPVINANNGSNVSGRDNLQSINSSSAHITPRHLEEGKSVHLNNDDN